MPSRHPNRDVTFDVVRNVLEMRVTLPGADGRSYTHRCERNTFREIIYAIEERAADGTTVEELVAATGLPHTQVAVALAFLVERGCVIKDGRRNFPASDGIYADAMCEFTYLAEAPY